MAAAKPIIVIIHGGWHLPSHYAKLTSALRTAGYEVHLPALVSMNGTRPPHADLVTDTALIHSYVTSLVSAGRTVMAVMHSYGGQVGTNALNGLGVADRSKGGLKGGVVHLVYLCAFALPEGGSMVGIVKEFGHEHLIPLALDIAEDYSCMDRDPKTIVLGPGLSDAETDEYVENLMRWNGKSMYQAIEKCAWKDEGVGVSYVMTSDDRTVSLDYQKSMVEGMRAQGKEVETVELKTGHCPHATMTKEVVDFIIGVGDKIEMRA